MSKFKSDGFADPQYWVSTGDPDGKLLVHRFADWELNSPEHEAIKAFLLANDIPANETPSTARFTIFNGSGHHPMIQIAQFCTANGAKQVSFTGEGFVKCERVFDLVAPLDQFGVRTVVVGEAFNLVDPPVLTEDRVRQIVDEKLTEFANLIAGGGGACASPLPQAV